MWLLEHEEGGEAADERPLHRLCLLRPDDLLLFLKHVLEWSNYAS